MLLVKNGEIKVKASTHSTRIILDQRGLEYDIAELTVDKIWVESHEPGPTAGDKHGRIHAGRDGDDKRGLA